jgi:hypothetical protein
MIRLRFVDSSDVVSRIIKMGELGIPYQHVEAVTADGLYLGAHMQGGVEARAVGYDAGTFAHELFVELPASDAQTTAFYGFLDAQLGKLYDNEAILTLAEGFATDKAPNLPEITTAWICSALQMAALIAAGVAKSAPQSVRLTTPRDVLAIAGALTLVGA